eukprot:COSAG01_NODE_43938_length_424_cov_1.409231_1_plen_137_part_10
MLGEQALTQPPPPPAATQEQAPEQAEVPRRWELGRGAELGAGAWVVRPAPDHSDLRWETLHVGESKRLVIEAPCPPCTGHGAPIRQPLGAGPTERRCRSLLINALILCMLVFCTTPIAFFNALQVPVALEASVCPSV